MNTETRKFHLGDILAITTGICCPPNRMEGISDILEFMTNDELYTTQLGRASDECKPYLLEQFPQLAEITATHLTYGDFELNFDRLVTLHGAFHEVRRIHPEDHQVIDPQTELAMTNPDLEVFNINLDDESEE